MNKCVITGRITKDPELKFVPGSGKAVANFTLAVNRRFKQEGQQNADFIPVVVWGKQAEATANYMGKGSQLSVAGRIQTRSYDNKEGNKVYITEIVADEVEFLDSKKTDNTSSQIEYDEDMQQVGGDIPF
ncbi:single-stranded DNA-binding protein [Clostridium brassicae]|uniref:Single-stranded DNA-binding protein n=1 Tax=Clostridium brassicae TaxID=2999072 RepID=A0ABT4D9M0_9CLOT|nr:single-stranded DNA-binding protein [Clostridium brassicae]MCY6957871.1 single-stranded DNA-binding protein [Clostridium brassicae]